MEKHIKYPRTYHLPWSPGATSDDKTLPEASLEHFSSLEVVVTEKMDGENTTLYNDHVHARSINSGHHPSRAWVKALHAQICYQIPDGMRICGENLYAQHSIAYDDLASYFMVFNIWTMPGNVTLSWDDTVDWCQKLGLEHVPVLYRGAFNRELIHEAWEKQNAKRKSEGYVVRFEGNISYLGWSFCAAKWVRENHVQTDEHWMSKTVVPNKLKV